MLKTKRCISISIVIVIIASLFIQSINAVNAKSKTFYANKTKVTIQKSGYVTITSKLGGSLSCKVSKPSICTAKWGKWSGNKIKLKLKGKKYGKTTVTVTNKKTNNKIKVKVNVKTVELKLPKTPFIIKNYDWDGYLDEEVEITKVWYKVNYIGDYDKDPSVKLYVRGTKTFSKESSNTSTRAWIPWKAYKGNIVKDSDEILTTDIEVGEGFEGYDYVDLAPGKYKIKFLNYSR